MSRCTVLALSALLMLGSGCAAVSDYLGYPMGEYRAEKELRAQFLGKMATTRGDIVDTDTGEVVFPAGAAVTIADIRYRPTRFPKPTGEVVIAGEGKAKIKLGFTSRIREHFLIELNQVLVLEEPTVAETFPLRLTPAEERAVEIAILKQEFVGRPLWLARDMPCTENSRRAFLPVGTEVKLEETSVVVSEGVDGEQVLSWLEFTDGDGNRVALFLGPPHRSFAEWYAQMAEVVTTEEMTLAPEVLPVGLSRDAVLASWGPPDRRRGRLSNVGVREEWTYALRGETLVFEDGRLTGR